MDITRLDPKAVAGVSSTGVSSTGASSTVASGNVPGASSSLSFAEVLKTQSKQAETGRSGAIAALLNRGVAAVAPSAETGALTVQAVPPTDETAADAASTLREWTGASRSRKARNGESPLALSAQDSSLAGRYDVIARRDENDNRGVRHSQRA